MSTLLSVVAIPAFMFIYPITIVLILLNVVPDRYASNHVFRAVVLATIIFSIPDFLGSIGFGEAIANISKWIPLSSFQMGWVLPALLVFTIVNVVVKPKHVSK